MFEHPFDFERDHWEPASSAKRFEAGSPNTMGQAAMDASVQLLLDYGMDKVGARVLANTGFLLRELGKIPGVMLSSRTSPDRQSGIVSFRHESVAAEAIHQALAEAGVDVVIRGGSIRVSPHFYQDEEMLGRFMNIVGSAAR